MRIRGNSLVQPARAMQLVVPGFTPVVKALLIANLAVFVLSIFVRDSIFDVFGVSVNRVLIGWVWQPFTYMFVHSNVGHLFWNMLSLWIFGAEIETVLGSRRFRNLYIISGVGAGIINLLVNAIIGFGFDQPNFLAQTTIGASGAIFSIYLVFAMLFPDRLIGFLLLPITIRAKHLMLILGVVAFLFALTSTVSGGAAERVSHITHLGGLLMGYLYYRSLLGVSRERAASSRLQTIADRWLHGPRQWWHDRQQRQWHKVEVEVDRILDKISRQGISSITPRERKILQKARRRPR